MPAPELFAIQSHPSVAAFLGGEPDVKQWIRDVMRGASTVYSRQIAGLPSFKERMRIAEDRDAEFTMPTITITLEFKRHHLTGARMVRLAVSEADIAEIERWMRDLSLGVEAPRIAKLKDRA